VRANPVTPYRTELVHVDPWCKRSGTALSALQWKSEGGSVLTRHGDIVGAGEIQDQVVAHLDSLGDATRRH